MVIGTAIGLLLGYGISYAGGHYHIISLSPEVYSIDYVPFDPRPMDGLLVAIVAIGVSFIATLYPSWSAGRTLPAEALAEPDSRNKAEPEKGAQAEPS